MSCGLSAVIVLRRLPPKSRRCDPFFPLVLCEALECGSSRLEEQLRSHLEITIPLTLDTCIFVDMCSTCSYVMNMPTMIQIRHVPDPLHRKLKARAAHEGKSLSDYLLREIQRVAERPTLEEVKERLALLSPVNPRVPPARIIREERNSR